MAESESGRLELLADPSAAGRARAWLKARLPDWSPDGIETVQLLASELVTNAILHTNDVVEVSAQITANGITVEVTDRNPTKPIVKTYGAEAATGRGLRLVEALSDAWGVRGDGRRKAVWFRVLDGVPRQASTASADDLLDAFDDDDDAWPAIDGPAAAPPGSAGGPQMTVCLSALPVAVYLAAEEHHDALMREFALLLRARRSTKVSPRLMELAASLAEQFGVGNEQRRAQVEAARRSGQRTVDVVMLFPAGSQDRVLAVAAALNEVDAFCARGDLLTPPSTPVVKRFRRWYTDEVVRQISGLASRSWSYSLEPSPGDLP
ncbi:MAG TPA: ATP-binding protein [Mycobacteriales bacterium]|jgi:anti-sigma regulatory factor (Ser/Thr protein kinase)|nr:ATP-binding protein [Mycobacteriales bacterium]